MIKQNSSLEQDFRMHPRMKERLSIHCQFADKERESGTQKARVKNISRTGMLLEAETDILPEPYALLNFNTDLGHNNFIPRKGRVIWHKTKGKKSNTHLMGVEFVETSDFIRNRLEDKIDEETVGKTAPNYLKIVAEGALITALVGLLGWSYYLGSGIYADINRANSHLAGSTEVQSYLLQSYEMRLLNSQLEVTTLSEELDISRMELAATTSELTTSKQSFLESQQLVASLDSDLKATKALLSQTESMLAQANARNASMQSEIKELRGLNAEELAQQKVQFQSSIALLEEKKLELQKEIVALNKDLSFNTGNISNIEEGQKWFALYEQRLREVKDRIRHFRREARDMRIAAQEEMDRVKMTLGNNGYFIKGGEPVVVDEKKYNNVTPSGPEASSSDGQAPKVAIDVGFFK